ncbi:hypothetical protein [Acrocarpospora macrocephala]|uniref:hypothetical protein n=1 Tax=Acrocarpospora macrocephala TaxID=150177 RepID=UPI0012D36FCB|nr:hypothetical protein [Acrocarpospora macrocephala]
MVVTYITGESLSWGRAVILFVAFSLISVLLFGLPLFSRRLITSIAFVQIAAGLTIGVIGVAGMAATVAPDLERVRAIAAVLAITGPVVAAMAVIIVVLDSRGVYLAAIPPPRLPSRDQILTSASGDEVLQRDYKGVRNAELALVEACRNAIDIRDVHYIAYYVNGVCGFHVDVLDHSSLDSYFRTTDREQRRDLYERAGRQIIVLNSQLDRGLKKIESGILVRTVLDVAEGALYYYRLNEGVDVVAVTLDQEVVLLADEKLHALLTPFQVLPRGGLHKRVRSLRGDGPEKTTDLNPGQEFTGEKRSFPRLWWPNLGILATKNPGA